MHLQGRCGENEQRWRRKEQITGRFDCQVASTCTKVTFIVAKFWKISRKSCSCNALHGNTYFLSKYMCFVTARPCWRVHKNRPLHVFTEKIFRSMQPPAVIVFLFTIKWRRKKKMPAICDLSLCACCNRVAIKQNLILMDEKVGELRGDIKKTLWKLFSKGIEEKNRDVTFFYRTTHFQMFGFQSWLQRTAST